MFRLLVKIFFIFLLTSSSSFAKEPTFVSISPALTEIMFKIGAGDMLKAVSTSCSYPNEAKKKPIIGDSYFINEEMLLTIKPDYFLAPDSADFLLNRYKRFNIKPLCYKYKNIDDVYKNILSLGEITGKKENAKKLVFDMKKKIDEIQKINRHSKKILYVIQEKPLITIGNQSFINDIIEKSGNISITSEINSYYPILSEEYLIEKTPDIVILDHFCKDSSRLKKLFPNAKFVKITKEYADIIDRPGPRIYKSVEFFARL